VAGLAAMRMIGPVGSYRELGVQDHLCWVHGDRRDYRPRLSDFFRDGLERGLRVAYLGSEEAARRNRNRISHAVPIGTQHLHAALPLAAEDIAPRVRRPAAVMALLTGPASWQRDITTGSGRAWPLTPCGRVGVRASLPGTPARRASRCVILVPGRASTGLGCRGGIGRIG
jgi:hypothetical protein